MGPDAMILVLEILSFTSRRSGSVALGAAKMAIPDKFRAMVSPGEPGPIVHTALLISQWGSVQSAPRLSFLLFSFPPSPFPFPLPSLSFPFFPPLWTVLAAQESKHLGFSIIVASCWLLPLTSGCAPVPMSWGVWLPVCFFIQGKKHCCHETLV